MDERELVQKLLAKDAGAQELFYNTYRNRLYQACTYVLGWRDPDAEDLVHETFLAALRDLPSFRFQSKLERWLRQICVHLCYKHLRKRRRMVSQLNEELDALSSPAAIERQGREQEKAGEEKILNLVTSQKSLLGKPCQDLLGLRDGEGKSYSELAEILKVPIGTVMSRLARCKDALKELVKMALNERQHD